MALCLHAADPETALREALTFHAGFEGSTEAGFGEGDRRIHTAPGYKALSEARPGLDHSDIALAPGAGRFGDALQFRRKNTKAVYFRAARNVAYEPGKFSGTVSFWLSLDPETDLEPGYCDPIQVTDKDYNDAALWVDFTKDEKPRHFRLGFFGDLAVWNPQKLNPDKNPAFLDRLVVVQKPPFARERWTHVVVTYAGVGSGNGQAKLYLDGKLQGATPAISEPFTWDPARAQIRLGVNYVGLLDEVAIFRRALTDAEVAALYKLEGGVRTLYR